MASPRSSRAIPPKAPRSCSRCGSDGSATALNGHVDLGTGIRTALAQVVAEELDLPLAQVHMVLGDTARAPNQGATIASASLQIHAVPLRLAAAQARAWLLAQASERFGVQPSLLEVREGRIHAGEDPAFSVPFGELVPARAPCCSWTTRPGSRTRRTTASSAPSVPRVDIPAKLAGETVFVHDMRVPGMLHGRVVRPPYAGADHGDFIGNTLESVDESSIAHIPGIRAVVVIRDFVGIVAEREEHAEQALRELRVRWKAWPGLPALDDLEGAIRANPATQRLLVDEGEWTTRSPTPPSRCRAPMSGPTRCMPRSAPRARSRIGSPRARRACSCASGPARRTRMCCAPISRSSWAWRTWPSTSCAWRPPAATAATAPTTSRPTRPCSRARPARRCACSSRASRSTRGSPRARRS